jgi:hypothetical protein
MSNGAQLISRTAMAHTSPLSDAAVVAISEAIFAKGSPTVVQAYSGYGQDPLRFESAGDLCTYASRQRDKPSGSAHVAVHFRDTAGHLARKLVSLDPSKCGGFTHRYTFEGWGLIWVYMHLNGASPIGSFVSANSQRRAEKWSSTYPELDPPGTWNWAAVSGHRRRLARVLKIVV